MSRWRLANALVCGLAFVVATRAAGAQASGAARLHELVRGLTVTSRALVVGVRPEDDDGQLLAWLARGRSVETGYLSLTRGESAANYVGTESGTPLGAIRTQEVLASRRIDGAEQFFTRAFDFGNARNAAETFKHWPRDTLLAEVVTVLRAFRPHVIIETVSRGFGRDEGQY
ncbi:MAG: PIG-L family deacetylase, partial [Gemmatimonadaceae bacterium]